MVADCTDAVEVPSFDHNPEEVVLVAAAAVVAVVTNLVDLVELVGEDRNYSDNDYGMGDEIVVVNLM